MPATTREIERRRKFVWGEHYIRGKSAREIAEMPDINVSHVTISNDIKQIEGMANTLTGDFYALHLMDLLHNSPDDREFRLKVINTMARIFPVPQRRLDEEERRERGREQLNIHIEYVGRRHLELEEQKTAIAALPSGNIVDEPSLPLVKDLFVDRAKNLGNRALNEAT